MKVNVTSLQGKNPTKEPYFRVIFFILHSPCICKRTRVRSGVSFNMSLAICGSSFSFQQTFDENGLKQELCGLAFGRCPWRESDFNLLY